MTPQEAGQQAERVLFPEGEPITLHLEDDIGEKWDATFTMRPLPIKQAKRVNALAQKLDSTSASMTAIGEITDVLVDVVTLLLSVYNVQRASRDVVEASLSFEEARALLDHQLMLQRDHDFLLSPLRLALRIVDQMNQTMSEVTIPSLQPQSMPVSVASGASDSTSLSNGIPMAS